jgi:hypothetical protein
MNRPAPKKLEILDLLGEASKLQEGDKFWLNTGDNITAKVVSIDRKQKFTIFKLDDGRAMFDCQSWNPDLPVREGETYTFESFFAGKGVKGTSMCIENYKGNTRLVIGEKIEPKGAGHQQGQPRTTAEAARDNQEEFGVEPAEETQVDIPKDLPKVGGTLAKDAKGKLAQNVNLYRMCLEQVRATFDKLEPALQKDIATTMFLSIKECAAQMETEVHPF